MRGARLVQHMQYKQSIRRGPGYSSSGTCAINKLESKMSLDYTDAICNLLLLATAAALSEAKPFLVQQSDSLYGAMRE